MSNEQEQPASPSGKLWIVSICVGLFCLVLYVVAMCLQLKFGADPNDPANKDLARMIVPLLVVATISNIAGFCAGVLSIRRREVQRGTVDLGLALNAIPFVIAVVLYFYS